MILAHLAKKLYVITPSDTADLPGFGAIRCTGTAGNVVLETETAIGTRLQVTYPITVGETLMVDVRKVLSTGTTAVGLWCLAY